MRLRDFAKDVADRLPAVEDDRELVLRAVDLPAPPDQLHAPELVAEVGTHVYEPDYTVRQIYFFGSRRAYRGLGLLLLAQLLHRGPRHIRVCLAPAEVLDTDPSRALAERHIPEMLLLELPYEIDPTLEREGLVLAVDAFGYWPTHPNRHPLVRWSTDVYQLPGINLTNPDGRGGERREEQTALRGFGGLRGATHMARLLLDLSHPSSSRLMFELECEAGFRGVAPASHEIRLVLPGEFGWLPRSDFASEG